MSDSQKLDRILKILDKQQQETYIPSKWKPVVDYLEETDRDPVKVLEMLIGLDSVFRQREERLKRENDESISWKRDFMGEYLFYSPYCRKEISWYNNLYRKKVG